MPVTAVAADITTAEGRAEVLAACPEPDILVNNAGGPPPGDFRDWDEAAWMAALRANMLTPIELMRAVVDGMGARGFGRIVNITSAAVKAPIAELGLSNGRVTASPASWPASPGPWRGRASRSTTSCPAGSPPTGSASNLAANAKRRGCRWPRSSARHRPRSGRTVRRRRESGQLCASMCSTHAGYITGQNVLIDGGAFPGTL